MTLAGFGLRHFDRHLALRRLANASRDVSSQRVKCGELPKYLMLSLKLHNGDHLNLYTHWLPAKSPHVSFI